MQPDTVIRTTNLFKNFGNFTAVNDLSLAIKHGEIFGFLGPNGAGKTTSINMICGLSHPSSGDIEILGENIRNNRSVKTKIGICTQENIFWPKLTCYEQLKFIGSMYDLPVSEQKKNANKLLDLLGLSDKSDVLAYKLSGGMKRRLSIALALVHNPEIIVLDEPEAGLDPQSRVLVRNFIKELAGEKTVILTTHNMDEADRLSDRIAIIDNGKLLLLDSPECLKRSIGEGDTLQVTLDRTDFNHDEIKSKLKSVSQKIIIKENVIRINAQNLVVKISEITRLFESIGLKISSITLRENTLEDVFIHLTGRNLRQ
ncbi:MAG: ABC transporter ATP-binding protein [Melioribacteraceae bacterium]|nr:ABC transporter ATP-binding protein [Melioribacteraceae bacterium]MCF8353012.1 ABC transporter ATP-binding protein [Melioribacteraceae bacterium]MCF8392903.1 ABC transporter ATP-binding protein [Melioribacteraceae bacterium]MCF8417803.1 ABC transporter ATP-binding protein [Melioribacteraceae bacterium]